MKDYPISKDFRDEEYLLEYGVALATKLDPMPFDLFRGLHFRVSVWEEQRLFSHTKNVVARILCTKMKGQAFADEKNRGKSFLGEKRRSDDLLREKKERV